MRKVIAILEDDPRRVDQMRSCVAEAIPKYDCAFFENAPEMIGCLRENIDHVVAISLDHDLPLRRIDGKLIDFGTGRMVADFLAAIQVKCPIIIHSSNPTAAQGMMFVLKDAGCTIVQVFPCDDLSWIGAAWLPEVARIRHN